MANTSNNDMVMVMMMAIENGDGSGFGGHGDVISSCCGHGGGDKLC